MKQLKLTGFIFFLCFLTESLTLPTQPQDVDNFSSTQKFIEENLEYITIIAFAQYVQEATFEEMEKLVKDMVDYKDRCMADKTLPECSKLPVKAVLDLTGLQNSGIEFFALSLISNIQNFTHCRFTFEYSRRHPDLSIPGLLRIVQIYKDLLRNCCNTENPPGCYRYVEDKFNETTEKSLKMVQQECKHFQNLGKDGLTYQYLIRLTKIAPQLSSEELVSLGRKMVTAFTTCCTLSEEFACVDNLADLVLGELCGVNENRTINPAVDHCCKTNFAFRRPCFESLKADKTYVPPPFSQDLFTFHADMCQSQNEELQRKTDRFLVNVVKLKHELTDEELQSLFTNFTNAVEKCCKAESPEVCFNEESPKIGN
ncbi:afamin-like [Theropithecus gelada]|uniref:afamin-like n=1 Tax=Theropithecus gelada TaxID=9565 RepID=UPI000DC1ABC9|nr:afamin-like [Theropithecus gelada]